MRKPPDKPGVSELSYYVAIICTSTEHFQRRLKSPRLAPPTKVDHEPALKISFGP